MDILYRVGEDEASLVRSLSLVDPLQFDIDCREMSMLIGFIFMKGRPNDMGLVLPGRYRVPFHS